MFSGLSPLAVEEVADQGERIWGRTRTPEGPAACRGCGAEATQVHHLRTAADVPVDERRVVVRVRVRRLAYPTHGCRHTFRKQVPGAINRATDDEHAENRQWLTK